MASWCSGWSANSARNAAPLIATDSTTTPSKSRMMSRGYGNGSGPAIGPLRDLVDQIEQPLAEVEIRGLRQAAGDARLIRVRRHVIVGVGAFAARLLRRDELDGDA